jgi:AraC-like DNA-binding protein
MVKHYLPHPALQTFIGRMLLIRYKFNPCQPRFVNPFPPQPEHSLYFYPYDKAFCHNYTNQSTDELPHSIIVGPKLSRVDLSMGHNMLIIYVGFRPGGLHRLLGIPMYELMDQSFESSLILGKEIEQITEQLYEACDFDTMMSIVQNYLLRKVRYLKKSLPVDQALLYIQQKRSLPNIDELARQACISVRQLERQCNERIGMPPKVFARLVRFSKAWHMRENNPHLSWLQIAHACDFADQMHMIRDFKDFAGVTPTLLQTDLEKSPLRLQGEMIG